VEVIMDRPLGCNHPKHGFRYEVNYGYVPNTLAPDGEEIDVYVLGVDKPLEKLYDKYAIQGNNFQEFIRKGINLLKDLK
jgi:inorganic pyrophosphatase